MNEDFMNALDALQSEKNIDKEELFSAIESSIRSAYQKNYKNSVRVEVSLNRDTGEITVYEKKNVVDEVIDPKREISLEEAQTIDPNLQEGDIYRKAITPKDFGRIAAQNAKQLIIQRIKDAELSQVYDEFANRIDEIVVGIITRIDKGNVMISIGSTEAILPPQEQVVTENYDRGQRLKSYILSVRNNPKNSQIIVSRSHPKILKRLFEDEVPEIFDGIIDIKSVAREPGLRSKIAVVGNDSHVDPVGACVGPKGSRVLAVSKELNNEKIDVVRYSDDPKEFIINALNPAVVEKIIINEKDKKAVVVVNPFQLSLAIGKEGLNVKLAAKLTGWKIDIKSTEEYENLLSEDPDFDQHFNQKEIVSKKEDAIFVNETPEEEVEIENTELFE